MLDIRDCGLILHTIQIKFDELYHQPKIQLVWQRKIVLNQHDALGNDSQHPPNVVLSALGNEFSIPPPLWHIANSYFPCEKWALRGRCATKFFYAW